MPAIYNPYDWYWNKRDGSAYHSRRQREVSADDPEYQAWLAEGHTPKQYPVNRYGREDRNWMLAILKPWGLKIYPLTEAEQATKEMERAILEESVKIIRPPNPDIDEDMLERWRREKYENRRKTIAQKMREAGNSGF